MKKILILGGSKFIGKEIANKAYENGFDVTLFNRGKNNIEPHFKLIQGDINEVLNYKDFFLKEEFDFVIDCICNTEKNAENLVEIFKNTKTKLIVLSSQDCYDAFQILVRGNEIPDFPINELSKLTDIKYYWKEIFKGKADDYDKNLMTDILIEAYNKKIINTTIFRLPMVYGPNDYQFAGRHGQIIKRIIDKEKNYVISSSDYNKIYTFAYVENIAEAIIYSLSKDITNGKIYNLGEEKVRTWKQWSELYAKYNNFEFNFFVLPDEVMNRSNSLCNTFPQNFISDASLFSIETGYKESISLEEGIKRTFQFVLENPSVINFDIDYKKEKESLDLYLNFISNFKVVE